MNAGLVKLVEMTQDFFNNQHVKFDISGGSPVKYIKSSFFGNKRNQSFTYSVHKT